MFNIGVTELIVILLVAFLVVGPHDLPKVARTLARGIKKIRGIVKDIKDEMNWDALLDEANDVKDSVADVVKDVSITDELRIVKDQIDTVKKVTDVQGNVKKARQALKRGILETGIEQDLQDMKAETAQAINRAAELTKDAIHSAEQDMIPVEQDAIMKEEAV